VRSLSRNTFLATVGAAAVTPIAALSATAAMPAPRIAAKEVRDEFLHAWDGYKKFAWGADEVKPVSGTSSNFFIDSHSFGLSIIESMDTLYVMELDAELALCVTWLRSNLDFDVDGEVQMFEANIRMVAGLLTGYYATGEKFLLDAAKDLADRLLVCFTKSPTGAPYRFTNLRTGAVRDPKNNLAEIGSNILEFGDLSRLTGESKYLDASLKALEVVIAKRSALDLLGTNFDIEKGEFMDHEDVAPDEPVDSFYEYLWGAWQMLGITKARDWYRMLTDAIIKNKVVRVNGQLWFRDCDYVSGAPMGKTVLTELSAFYAELVAKGGDRKIGEEFYDSWTDVLNKYELIPEEIDYSDLSIISPVCGMRPEYPNSAFDLWFLTHNEKYRRTGYQYFQALRKNCRVPNGYTTLKDVRTRPMTLGDHFPAYSFSENFKYLYLMFADAPRFDSKHYYLNTEGKILRGMRK
jgi:mannosyl-oligosaccharide alpha-1,2-mannosidase